MTTMVDEKLSTNAILTATDQFVGPKAPSAPIPRMKPVPMIVIMTMWDAAVN